MVVDRFPRPSDACTDVSSKTPRIGAFCKVVPSHMDFSELELFQRSRLPRKSHDSLGKEQAFQARSVGGRSRCSQCEPSRGSCQLTGGPAVNLKPNSDIPKAFEEDRSGLVDDSGYVYDNVLKNADMVTKQFDPLKLMQATVNEFWLLKTGLTYFAKASLTSSSRNWRWTAYESPILAGVVAASSLSCVHGW